MSKRIFISYRRAETMAECGRIYDRLKERYGDSAVYRDVNSTPLGANFRRFIRGVLGQCAVELVIIGRSWLDMEDEHGRRRLDNPEDLVRQEVSIGLKQRHLIVIPVLVDGGVIPKKEDLPDDLVPLADRHSIVLRDDPNFHADMDRLCDELDRYVRPVTAQTATLGIVNQYDQTYPRRELSKFVRSMLIWSPLLILACLSIAILVLSDTLQKLGIISWAIVTMVGIGILSVIGSVFAIRDLRVERRILKRENTGAGIPVKLDGSVAAIDESHELVGPPFDDLPEPPQFIGRVEALKWTIDQLQEGGVAGITAIKGMGGIGKTTVAAMAIRELREVFPDGIAVIVCENRHEWSDVVQRVLGRFDPQRQRPKEADAESLAESAHRRLFGKKVLIVLDNVEPRLDIVKVVTPLRQAGATLLLTSREALPIAAVPPQGSLTLDLLSDNEALELFAQSYGKQNASELRDNERRATKQIISLLDHHTLAVKLAGAYAKGVHPDLQALAVDLQADPLSIRDAEIPRPLAKVFERSINALPPESQIAFAGLAAFARGEFGRRAALDVAAALGIGDPKASIDLLIVYALMDTYVLDFASLRTDSERLHLHPLVRYLAVTRFGALSPVQQNSAKLGTASYYARYTNDIETEDWAISQDETNIHSALEWAHENRYLRLLVNICIGMQRYWRDRARTKESLMYLPWGQAAAETLAARSTDRIDRLRAADLALSYGITIKFMGRLDEAKSILDANLAIRREVGDVPGEAKILTELGWIAQRRSSSDEDLDEAESYYRQGLELIRKYGTDRKAEGWSLYWIGEVERFRENWDAAERIHLDALAIRREVGDRLGEDRSLCSLGRNAISSGDYVNAENYIQQALDLAREVQDRWGEAFAISAEASLARSRGQLRVADELYQRSLAIDDEVQSEWDVAIALNILGFVADTRGFVDDAEEYYRKALSAYVNLNHASGQCDQLRALATLNIGHGRFDVAESYLRRALALARRSQDKSEEFQVHMALASLAIQKGQQNAAEIFYQRAHGITSSLQPGNMAINQLLALARYKQSLSQADEADTCFVSALELARRIGDWQQEANVLTAFANAELARKHFEMAAKYFQQVEAMAVENAQQQRLLASKVYLSRLASGLGRIDEAELLLVEALELARALKDIESPQTILDELGDLESEREQFDKAENYYGQALECAVDAGNERARYGIMISLGDLEVEREQLDNAEHYFQMALDVCRKTHIRIGEAQVLNKLGRTKRAGKQYEQAKKYFLEALDLDRELNQLSYSAVTLVELARLALEAHDHIQAESSFQEALEIEKRLGDLRSQRVILNDLAGVALERLRYDEAADYYIQALVIDRELKDLHAENTDLLVLGQIESARGRQEAADVCFQQALDIVQELDDGQIRSADLTNLGRLALRRGRLDEAESCIKQALNIDRDRNNQKNVRVDLIDLAQIAQARKMDDEAQRYFEQAAAVSRELSDSRSLVSDLTELTRLELAKGREADADKYVNELLAAVRESGDRSRERLILVDLATLALSKHRYNEAEDYYKGALSIDVYLVDLQHKSTILTALGRLAQHRYRDAEAEEYFQQALMLDKELSSLEAVGLDLGDMASLAAGQKKYFFAETYLTQALDVSRELKDRQGESGNLAALARVKRQRGQFHEAETCLKHALDIDRELSDTRSEGADLTDLGYIAIDRGNLEEADTLLRQALSIDRETGNVVDIAFALAEQGLLAQVLGDVAKGEQLEQEALATFPRAKRLEGEAPLDESPDHIASGLDLNSELKGFLRLLMECEAEKFGPRLPATIQVTQPPSGEWITTLEDMLKRTLSTARTEHDVVSERIILMALGQLATLFSQLQLAEGYFSAVLEVDRVMQSKRCERETLCELGRLARQRKRAKDAEILFQKALIIDREMQDLRSESEDLIELARTLAQSRRKTEAQRYYRGCLDILATMGLTVTYANVAAEYSRFLRELRTRGGDTNSNQQEAAQVMADALNAYQSLGIRPPMQPVTEVASVSRQRM